LPLLGLVVDLRSQKIWEIGIYTGPENLDEMPFHIIRKSGRLVFTLVQKFWTSCIIRFSENLGEWYLPGPENLDHMYFHVPRKSG
jgi:hypothetical protein